ncbi:MAG: DsbA family oxidoreductase [Phototrophicaceae bacterium]
MAMHVDVWSDFVCPWCFLVSTSLEKLEASHGVTVAWKSYELRPKGSPPMPENYRARIEAMRPQMEAMAKSQYGIELKSGKFGIDSRPALIGEKFAEQFDRGARYHKAVFEAYWLHAQNIEDTIVLGDIAESVGLNRDDFLNSLTDPELEALVDADVQLARDYQLNGVPALIFADKFYIPGAQPYEELVRVVEQITQRLEQD